MIRVQIHKHINCEPISDFIYFMKINLNSNDTYKTNQKETKYNTKKNKMLSVRFEF